MDIQVAISQDFLTAIVRLPRAQQKKVNQFVSKFRNDPLASGINYEKINDAANSDMRSVGQDATNVKFIPKLALFSYIQQILTKVQVNKM